MKEQPKYNCQKQYEKKLKDDYKSMLTNMGKALIASVNKTDKDKRNDVYY